jgi:hypothetical protein
LHETAVGTQKRYGTSGSNSFYYARYFTSPKVPILLAIVETRVVGGNDRGMG